MGERIEINLRGKMCVGHLYRLGPGAWQIGWVSVSDSSED